MIWAGPPNVVIIKVGSVEVVEDCDWEEDVDSEPELLNRIASAHRTFSWLNANPPSEEDLCLPFSDQPKTTPLVSASFCGSTTLLDVATSVITHGRCRLGMRVCAVDNEKDCHKRSRPPSRCGLWRSILVLGSDERFMNRSLDLAHD